MNAHKRMAGAGAVGKVESFPTRPVAHPDAGMDTGRSMGESERSVGNGVQYAKGNLPAQQAPDHGPHNLPGWNRG